MLFYHYDGIGNVVNMTGANGVQNAKYIYDAFGNQLQVSGAWTATNDYAFSTKEKDASGLVYYGARYYNPEIGRWTQRDPMGFVDGPNVYAFVGNNPVNFVDEWGLWGQQDHFDRTFDAMVASGYSKSDASHAGKASYNVDYNPIAHLKIFSARHYLEGQDSRAQKRISKLYKKAVRLMKEGNREGALKALGQALHTVQDKYSHAAQGIGSNWEHFNMWDDNPNPDDINRHADEWEAAYQASKELIEQFKKCTS
jgi:RHS repeat-associated protein